MTVSSVHEYLLDHGPSTRDELPYIPQSNDRQAGVQAFNPSARHGDSRGGHNQRRIYYVGGAHDPIEVIEAWLDANEVIAETANAWQLHHRISAYGVEWKDASREMIGPFDDIVDGGNIPASGGTCPLCGESYERALADHLPECGEG